MELLALTLLASILGFYIIVRVISPNSTVTIRSLGVILIIIGLFGTVYSTPALSSNQVEIENIETYEGVQNVKQYNESEYIPIGDSEEIEIVVSQETERIDLLSQQGEKLEVIDRGNNHIEPQELKQHDLIVVEVIDSNGNTIDKGNLTVRTDHENISLR